MFKLLCESLTKTLVTGYIDTRIIWRSCHTTSIRGNVTLPVTCEFSEKETREELGIQNYSLVIN